MSWVAGIRGDILYTVQKRPLDPRWSDQDVQVMLAWCASAQALGWTEQRAFQAAEALVFRKRHHGLTWANQSLLDDMDLLLVSREKHEAKQDKEENNGMKE